ncbi:hypothetical protein [Pelagibius sp.]|uniref:hypothetical protein n=1 Tax=Pelagibius sp. TaxID=1931238 RepID=UPI00261DAD73|nr:hypothetical protein [Pelagibius sp.]
MAVTQQIVRLTEAELEACSNSEAELNRLIGYELRCKTDHLDLNWAPRVLEHYLEASHQLPEAKLALFLACNGARLVNTNCRRGPGSDWVYSDVTCLSKEEVARVASGFQTIAWEELTGWLPTDRQKACDAVKMQLDHHPDAVFPDHMRALAAFYDEAARAGLCTAMWWD